MLRVRYGEHFAERMIGENCAERERLGEKCPEILIGEYCAEREIGGTLY